MKNLIYSLLSLFLLSCASVRVDYDFDKTTNFDNYATYNYFSDMTTGLSQLDEKRLLKVLDSALRSKGYLLSEEPDFLVNIESGSYRSNPSNNVGVGIGGTGGRVGGGVSIGLPINSSLKREIQFDFVDSQKNALFWQAVSESGFRENASPSVRETQLKKVVDKVFAKFPPGKQ